MYTLLRSMWWQKLWTYARCIIFGMHPTYFQAFFLLAGGLKSSVHSVSIIGLCTIMCFNRPDMYGRPILMRLNSDRYVIRATHFDAFFLRPTTVPADHDKGQADWDHQFGSINCLALCSTPKSREMWYAAHYVWFSWFWSHLKMWKNVFWVVARLPQRLKSEICSHSAGPIQNT